MNAKKFNYTTNTQPNNEDTIVISIKDGYTAGDELFINSNNIQYSWSANNQSLLVNTTNNTNILDVLSLIQIKGNGEQDRFLDVTMVTSSGEHLNLTEFNLKPYIENSIIKEATVHINHSLNNTKEIFHNVNDSTNTNYLNATVQTITKEIEQEDSVNFLPNATEEKLPITISKMLKNSEEGGDIYRIIKDSFIETDKLEIWGYNALTDKVDLEECVKDLNAVFDYSITNNDLELNLHTADKDYSIVLKDISTDKFSDSVDEAIAHIVINSIKV